MERLLRGIGLRGDDRKKMLLMAPVFLLCGIAEMMNYNGFMTLFNQRLGSEYLPYLYTAEAVILPLEAWLMSWLTGRMSKPAFMRLMFGVMVGIVGVNALILIGLRLSGLDIWGYYFCLFITSNFVVRQQTLLLWSLAVDLCPTQQAKRLIPVFVSSALIGGIAAGGLAQLITSWQGADAVYFTGVLFLLAGGINYRKAIDRYLVPITLKVEKNAESRLEAGNADSTTRDYIYGVMRSPFLLCAVGLTTLMPALYFLMEYQFLTFSHLHFPREEQFGRFFGQITMVMFILAFALQLVSGKLSRWLGQTNMLLAISGVFTAAFAGIAFAYGTSVLMAAASLGYMFVYVLLYYFAEPAQQLFYKLLPIRQRDGYRYVISGFSTSAGILLGAFLQFLHTRFGVGFVPLSILGGGLSGVLILIAYTARRMYIAELLQTVGAGRHPEGNVAAAFDEFLGNAKAMESIRGILNGSNDYAKELALQIMVKKPDAAHLNLLLELAEASGARIRVAALKAMEFSRADLSALVQVASFLDDRDPEVRGEAVKVIAQAKSLEHQAFYFIRMMLLDTHPLVVAQAVRGLYALGSVQSFEACYEAIQRYLKNGGEQAVHMCETVADLEMYSFLPEMERLLEEGEPAVRVAAVQCIGRLRHAAAVERLIALLPAAEPVLRKAVANALIEIGPSAVQPLLGRLQDANPKVWSTAVGVLAMLLDEETKEILADCCIGHLLRLTKERGVEVALASAGWPELARLAALRMQEHRQLAYEAVWSYMSAAVDEQAAASVRGSVQSQDEEERDNGLELLSEGFGHKRLSSTLIDFILAGEENVQVTEEEAEAWLEQMEESRDRWLNLFAEEIKKGRTPENMGNNQLQMGLLDKAVLLTQTSLFADLSLEELSLIADVAIEEIFPDQSLILSKGEPNSSLYVIVDGHVELSSGLSGEGGGTLGVLGEKEVFGESSALANSPSTVTAAALLGEARVLRISGEQISRLIRLHPEIGFGLLQASFARVRLLEDMVLKLG